ncbi:MAG: carboxypeptidase-like regulatory domain-containing protein [Terracidiphilus sp.]|nr:carboxypeptidase-like regulatory domain-containing protein [Terracidiphilus sp.]
MNRFRLLLVFLFSLIAVGHTQEFRATISGRVSDPSGAVVPNAQIQVTNQESGIKASTVSNSGGDYVLPFLLPGKYSLTAIATGFSPFTRNNFTVQTGDKLGIDIALSVGAQADEITVTADVTLLQTETSTSGQVLTPLEIENLPDNGRSPMALAKTQYAVIPKQKNSVIQGRPFDNSASSDFSIGGGASQSNEYLLNGVPNMQSSSRLPAYSPLQDSVSEMRVDVFQSDASYGDTSNGTVNIITKSGGNKLHGALSEFNQFSAINAPSRWFLGTPTPKQLATRQNQYGIAIGGPVLIPKLYDGRNKLFFFYAYEGFKGSDPQTGVTTVPTANERKGDFSALLAQASAYQLYNPYTATLDSKGNVVRTAIPNNDLTTVGSLNAVALKYLSYFPDANTTPTTKDGQNNYAYSYPKTYDYSSNSGRLDYTINERNAIFFETHRSVYTQNSGKVFPNLSQGSTSYTVHQGGVVDYIHTFSPSYTIDTRMGLTRTYTNGTLPSAGFDPTSVGLPSYMSQAGSPKSLPQVAFSESGTAYQTLSSLPSANTAYDTISLFSALTALRGSHTLKLGFDTRAHKYSYLNVGGSSNLIINGSNVTSGATSGAFTFAGNFLSQSASASLPTFGSSLASFLLGIPTSGQFNINPKPQYNSNYFGGFLQDDWKIKPNLTLNAGIRLESETSIVESHDMGSWFEPTATNSVAAPATAAYAANTISQLPLSSFNAEGGLRFFDSSRRSEYFTPVMYVNPRLGLSYAPSVFNNKLIARAGFGLYFSPYNDYYTPQTYGYSSTMSYVPTTNNYLTPATSLSDPFPTSSNPITKPTGSTLGANTYLGQAISIRPTAVQTPYSERWNLDFQYQLTPNTMVQIGYIGAHSVHMSYTNQISSAPLLPFLSRSAAKDSANEAILTSKVANPFYGLSGMTGSLASSTTISRFALLQKYPQYSSVSQQLVPGASALFHELAIRVQKRTSHGLTYNFNYQWSHNLTTSQLNAGDVLKYGENASDFPTHVSVAGSYLLPIGRGKLLFSGMNRTVDTFIGGFTVNGIYTYLTGAAIGWGSIGGSGQPYFKNGTSWNSNLKIRPRNYSAAIDPSLFADVAADRIKTQPTAYNYRTFPLFFGRQDATNNFNISVLKDFKFGEHARLQYRCESYNIFNHAQFGAPNVTPSSSSFGQITSQANSPRVIQQGLRLIF